MLRQPQRRPPSRSKLIRERPDSPMEPPAAAAMPELWPTRSRGRPLLASVRNSSSPKGSASASSCTNWRGPLGAPPAACSPAPSKPRSAPLKRAAFITAASAVSSSPHSSSLVAVGL
eukprot:scaffold302110_cov27-Tisochrysis_lutea.AAC.1